MILVPCPNCSLNIDANDFVGGSIECPKCGEEVSLPGYKSQKMAKATRPEQTRKTRSGDQGMVISSGDANRPFKVLGLVTGFASRSEGCGVGVQIEQTYDLAMARLKDSASELGASGLLFVNFQNRVASKQACGGPQQVFEVFAWGTAVRWIKPDE